MRPNRLLRSACVLLALTFLGPVHGAAPPISNAPSGAFATLGNPRWMQRGGASAVAYSPNGECLAVAGGDTGTVKLLRTSDGAVVQSFFHPFALFGVKRVSFSPDGSRLLTAVSDGTARVWEVATGKQVTSVKGTTFCFSDVAFSPDGKRFATAEGNGSVVRLWDASNGRLLHRTPTKAVSAVAFSPDGRLLAGGGIETIHLWDAQTGKRIRELPGRGADVGVLCFSPDSKTLAAGHNSGEVTLWPTDGGGPARSLRFRGWGVTGVRFINEGTSLVMCETKGPGLVWDLATGTVTRRFEALYGSFGLALSPDGLHLAAACHRVVLVDLRNGHLLNEDQATHTGMIHATAASPVLSLFATAGQDGTVRLWDSRTGKPGHILRGHNGPVHAVAFSEDGKTLASTGKDGTVRLWDPLTDKPGRVVHRHKGVVRAVALSPDGKRLVSGGADCTVQVTDLTTGRTRVLDGHEGEVFSVTFDKDGETPLSGAADGRLRLWSDPPRILVKSEDDPSELPDITAPKGPWITPLVPMPGGRLAYGLNARIRVMDLATGRRVSTVTDHSSRPVLAAALLRGGKVMATCRTEDGSVHFCDLINGREEKRLHFADYTVTCLAYDEKADVLLAGTREGVGLLIKPPAGLPAKP